MAYVTRIAEVAESRVTLEHLESDHKQQVDEHDRDDALEYHVVADVGDDVNARMIPTRMTGMET